MDDQLGRMIEERGLLRPLSAGPPTADASSEDGTAATGATQTWADVPWRTIWATIASVAAFGLLAITVYLASRIVIWIAIAGFFAVVLSRPVGWLQTRAHMRRGVAVGVVVLGAIGIFAGLVALFILPVRSQLVAVLTDLPGTVRQAADGRGPVGRLVTELHLEQLVKRNQESLTKAASSVDRALPGLVGSALQALLAVITIVVTTCLMLTQSEPIGRAVVRVLPVRHRGLMVDVAHDAARSVSGYMIGNLLISLCAGVAAFVLLLLLGVPSPAVLALWVAFADLIPLVGATLGALAAVFGAFSVSPTAGIIAVVFFALYQQFENSVLTTMVMARTVRVNPLAVLLSVVVGVELFGFVGALLALPVAGAIGVVVKEIFRRHPRQDELIIVGNSQEDQPPPTPRWHPRRLRRRRLKTGARG